MNVNVLKTINYIKKNGFRKGYYAVLERLGEKRKGNGYTYNPISEKERLEEVSSSMNMDISFSILVPAYETPEKYLLELIDSVRGQTYSKWELVIADASLTDVVKETVLRIPDARIKYIRLGANGGISENTNEGLKHCTGEYIGLLDHDDILTNDALYCMAGEISKSRQNGIELQMLYSDEDKTDGENTRYFDRYKKRDFNYDLILSNNYICHFLVLKSEIMKENGFRKEYDGAQDHDLILRTVSKIMDEFGKDYRLYICHIPKVLYHWRCHEASTASNPQSKLYAYEAGKRAVQDFLNKSNIKASVLDSPHMGFFYVKYEPDIFAQRPNVAAVGGRVIGKRNRVVGGVWNGDGELMFKGLNKNFSGGIFHEASCQMEVPYVDIRYMNPSKETLKEYRKFIKDMEVNQDSNLDYEKLSKEFCDIMTSRGYVFVYDPLFTRKENKK